MTHTFESIQAAYDEYIASKTERRTRVQAEVKAEVERRLEEEGRRDLERLSRTLHEAYQDGLSKAELRSATRKYTNSAAFNELWFAAPGAPKARLGRPPVHGNYVGVSALRGRKPWTVERIDFNTAKLVAVKGVALKKTGPKKLEWTGPEPDTLENGELELIYSRGFRGWSARESVEEGTPEYEMWVANRPYLVAIVKEELDDEGKTAGY